MPVSGSVPSSRDSTLRAVASNAAGSPAVLTIIRMNGRWRCITGR
jgi:hypothetical protein